MTGKRPWMLDARLPILTSIEHTVGGLKLFIAFHRQVSSQGTSAEHYVTTEDR